MTENVIHLRGNEKHYLIPKHLDNMSNVFKFHDFMCESDPVNSPNTLVFSLSFFSIDKGSFKK